MTESILYLFTDWITLFYTEQPHINIVPARQDKFEKKVEF